MSEHTAAPYQHAEHGPWALDIYDDQPVPDGRKYAPEMRVVFTWAGSVVQETTYPSYRIWTLLAHWTDDLPLGGPPQTEGEQ